MNITLKRAADSIREIAAAPLLIDGRLRQGEGQRDLPVVNPADAARIATIQTASAGQIEEAVAAAASAQRSWEAVPAVDRAALLHSLADAIESRADLLISVITAELGSPAGLSRRLHVELAVRDIRETAAALTDLPFERHLGSSTVLERAAGVVLAITPWNYPLHQVVAKVVPAIAAGCTVILKPSAQAVAAASAFARCVQESGLPRGVINVLAAGGQDISEQVIGHPDVQVVSFTGSTEVGSAIARQAASSITRVHLELGGKSPSLVAPSADMPTAVKVTLSNCFLNSGQSCNAWTRLLVPRDRLNAVETEILNLMPRHRPDDPWKDGTRMGPVVSSARQESIWADIRHAEERSVRVLAGGLGLPSGIEQGAYVRPTVFFDVDPEDPVAQEEIFGPVLTVSGYDDLDHALSVANGTRYGLGGSVWAATTEEAAAIARDVRSGQVDLNGGVFNPAAPFGGFKASGYGRELGLYGIQSYLETQSLQH